jgi:hypothetical protein
MPTSIPTSATDLQPPFRGPGLTDWLGDVALDDFRKRYLHVAPLAQPMTTLSSQALLDWAALDRLLARTPDALVVARGRLLRMPQPRSVIELRGYFEAGIGLALRHTERQLPELAALASSFREIGTPHVQAFVTPAGKHGFGWHYDDEDVFIAQTVGVKDYYFRANTVAADEPARPDMFSRFSAESSPLCTATLVAGDFLYLPARWWHMALCQEDALSISVGVFCP